MKTRNGFVSNSSSSSFLIRGARVKKKKVSEVFNLTEDDFYTITYNKDHELIHGTTENYFEDDNEARDDCIIGLEVVSFEDGEVVEFDQTNTLDIKVIESLRAVGIMATELSFFIQYVSTDNC